MLPIIICDDDDANEATLASFLALLFRLTDAISILFDTSENE